MGDEERNWTQMYPLFLARSESGRTAYVCAGGFVCLESVM